MKEKILRIFGSILLLVFLSCEKPDLECSLETIEEYAEEQCTQYAEYEQCKQEIIYLISVSCAI